MRLLISFLFVSCVFSASASYSDATTVNADATQEMFYPGPGKGRKAKKHNRIKRKRKRACSKWGRKSFAG